MLMINAGSWSVIASTSMERLFRILSHYLAFQILLDLLRIKDLALEVKK